MHIPMLAWHVHLHIGGWAGKHMLIDKQGCHIFVKMSNQVLLPLDMFSKKGTANALASSQFSDSSKEEDRSQCLSISNEVPYHNPRSNSSSSGVGSGSESGAQSMERVKRLTIKDLPLAQEMIHFKKIASIAQVTSLRLQILRMISVSLKISVMKTIS